MVRHFIILSSSYSKGQRIALDMSRLDENNINIFYQAVERIKNECGKDTSISMHCIATSSVEWESVVEEDAFFEDVLAVEDIESFIKVIQMDRTLSGLDIAKYILSKKSCTHLKLQKLVYYCYADYLCLTHEKLFKDEIYAFQFGPVVKTVRETFKGYKYIDNDNMDLITKVSSLKMPIRSRILFADKGIEKLQSINQTIDKYGELTASDLVNLTHKAGTPWNCSFDASKYRVISDEIIYERHYLEAIR